MALTIIFNFMHYKMYGSWNGYDGSETGAAAKLSGDYFTITDLAGNTVYTSEKGVERCCANPNHKYTRVRLPITVDGKTVGELTAGYFSNHISSPEADAFRGGGIWLVVLSIICISVVGAAISMSSASGGYTPALYSPSRLQSLDKPKLRSMDEALTAVSPTNTIAPDPFFSKRKPTAASFS